MRCLLLVMLGACIVGPGGGSNDDDPPYEPAPELTADQHYCDNQPLPPIALCGQCVCCLTCEAGSTFSFDAGDEAVVIDSGSATIHDGILYIAGTVGQRSIAIEAPALVGTHVCGGARIGFQYYAQGIVYGTTQTSECTLTITALGELGERIEGTFAASVSDRDVRIELSGGTFSVDRALPPQK